MNPLKICGLWFKNLYRASATPFLVCSIQFEYCYEKGLGKLVGTLPCVHSLGNLALSFFHQKVESGYLVSSACTAFISCFGPILCGRNDTDPVLILALRKLLLFFLWNPAIPIWTVWVCLLDNEWETWAQLLCPFSRLPANCLEYRGQLTYIMLHTQKASAVRWEVPPSVSRLSYQLADCAWNKWLFF